MRAVLAFRPASRADIETIRRLADAIWRESYAAMLRPPQIDYMLAWMYDPARISDEIDAGVLWQVAALNGTPIGYLSVTVHDQTAELNKLYLLPALQGQGLGQAMLTRAVALARSRNCSTMRLRVNKTNARALRAYERGGFTRVDDVVADIGGGFVMDDYVLARAIDTPP